MPTIQIYKNISKNTIPALSFFYKKKQNFQYHYKFLKTHKKNDNTFG